MTENTVTLEEMLAARELRAARQSALLQRFHAPLVCLTMNIPGPVKLPEGAERAFGLALERVERILAEHDASVVHRERFVKKTGCEAFFAVQADPAALKAWMTDLEDADALGRLLDLDVLTVEGGKLSRPTPRRCLLCGRQAQICARSRAHSLEELDAVVQAILREAAP